MTSRSGRPSAIRSIGLIGAPAAAAQISEGPVEAVVTPRRHDAMTPQQQPERSRTPRAGADTTVAYTLRLDIAEAAEIDALGLALRREAGRRTLGRSEVIRALLRLAANDDAVRAALVRELMTP